MNKPYGTQGEIVNFPWKDVQEVFYKKNGIEIEIKEGILFVGVDNETKLEEAKEIARLYLLAWSERQNIKVGVDFNHTWKTNAQGNQDHFLDLHEEVKVTDRVQIQKVTHQVTIKATALIVTQEMRNSASPANDTLMVEKALKDPTLRNALRYFSEEVVHDKKPLIGVYKAMEEITRHLGGGSEGRGRTALANLVSKTKKYVDDVMETSQSDRHSMAWITFKRTRVVLSDEECKKRAKELLNAYANSLP